MGDRCPVHYVRRTITEAAEDGTGNNGEIYLGAGLWCWIYCLGIDTTDLRERNKMKGLMSDSR